MFKVTTNAMPFSPTYDNAHDAIVCASHLCGDFKEDVIVTFPTGEEQTYRYEEGLILGYWTKL